MPDREKVKYSIERCISHVPDACRDCAYDAGHPYNECVEMMLNDVLSLLKEQEAVEPRKEDDGNLEPCTCWWFVCGSCGRDINPQDRFCRHCGKKVKWE